MGKKFCGLILKTSYDKMGESSLVEVLGKSMLDWVRLSFGDTEVSVTDYDSSIELPLLVRPFVKDGYDYIVVLFSDTPLITRKTVLSAVEEAFNSGRSVLKMTRGFVLSCAYILNSDKIYTNDTFYFDEEDFITAFNFRQVGLVSDILKNRILEFHMGNGVHFADLSSTVIGCDVAIDAGVTIGVGNAITGRTRIRKGAKVGNGNDICDSVIDEVARVERSVLRKAYLGKGASVAPFCVLTDGAIVEEGAIVESRVSVKNGKVGARSKIGANSTLTSVTVGSGVMVGTSCTLLEGVTVGDDSFVASGSVISESVASNSTAVARARQNTEENKSDAQ